MDRLRRAVGGGGHQEFIEQEEDYSDSWDYRSAQQYYLLGLIVADRTDEAEAYVLAHFSGEEQKDGQQNELSLPYGALASLGQAGAAGQVYAFAERMVGQDGGQALWPILIRLGAQLDLSDQVLEKLEGSIDEAEGDTRRRLSGHLADALLAADRVDEGGEALRQQIALRSQLKSTDQEQRAEGVQLNLQLAEIGRLTDRPAWLEEGLSAALEGYRLHAADLSDGGWRSTRLRQGLVAMLVRADRPREAEAVLIDALTRLAAMQEVAAAGGRGYQDASMLLEPMTELTELYAGAGRWADVLILLEQSPYWGEGDLAEVLTETGVDLEHGDPLPLGYFAAKALMEAGRERQAEDVTRELLFRVADQDSVYRLWLDVRGDGAVGLLDELYERDRYEERPLIWKAVWLLERGRIEEADRTIRAAIKVDPSDGEQGRGDRIRAYQVLGQVMAAQGDTEGAATMEGVVRAIRQAEDADRFYSAGLLSRSVKMYEEALTHFSEAYCIQSRLAVRLADMGRFDEAVAHYEKAYELMPDSFGRVESHCFGCEGVFSDERVQPIAERVFSRLLEASPEKPQLHYLMGYLLSTRDRDAEANDYYRRAVELDPQYLNAWSKLSGLSKRMLKPKAERDGIALQIFRLDPLGRHVSSSLDEVRDLSAAWEAVASVQSMRHEKAEELMELEATAQRLAEQPADDDRFNHSYRYHRSDDEEIPTPGEMLAHHQITRVAEQLLQFDRYR